MKRDNVIILKKEDQLECWGQLVELCQHHEEFSYNYLKGLKFPFKYKGYDFIKIPYRTKTIF